MHPAGQAMRGTPPGLSEMAVPPVCFKWLAGGRGAPIGARPPHPVALAPAPADGREVGLPS